MPDIQLRFQKDMLVLSAPLDANLARQGANVALDRQYFNLMEPDVIRDLLRQEVAVGAHCLVTTTEDITQARLAHLNMDADAPRLAAAALAVANEVKPQHVLAEIGPCGLPLDASSKASLNENRSQYANAARAFSHGAFDAFFLNGFTNIADLKCALMGVAQVGDKPVFASVTVGDDASLARAWRAALEPAEDITAVSTPLSHLFGEHQVVAASPAPPLPAANRTCLDAARWPEAVDMMIELGASVVGFETADPIARALDYARTAVARTELPVLAQLCVTQPPGASARNNLVPLEDIDEYTPDTMATSAVKLFGAGVQFLRATGLATSAYTGALSATVSGLDVHRV